MPSGVSLPEIVREIWGEQGPIAGPEERRFSMFPWSPTSRSIASVPLHFWSDTRSSSAVPGCTV